MATVHGSLHTYLLNGVDMSQFSDASDPERTADTHETTTYGKKSKTYTGGLLDGTNTIGGIYDTSLSGPAAIIEPLLGQTVPYVYRPEGTGSGKPQKTVSVVVGKYTESIPVGDIIRWSVDLQYTGDVVISTQP